MTFERIKNMIHFANIIGLKTTGDLMQFKTTRNIKTNEELYMTLYAVALLKKQSVS